MIYKFIDHIRGIAILMVILVHTSQSIALSEGLLSILTEYGQMGVQLFFIVSAYTLCLSHATRKGEKHAVINFYIRRFFRIAPLYYIGIVGYFLSRVSHEYLKSEHFLIPEQYTVLNVMANIVFVHGAYYPANNNIVPGGWSIGTEMFFYLVFPILFRVILAIRNSLFLIAMFPFVAMFMSAFIITVSGNSVGNNGFIYYSILNQFPVFMTGIFLYQIHSNFNWLALKFNLAILLFLFVSLSIFSIWFGWIFSPNSAFMFIPFLSAISFLPLIELFKRMDLRRFGLLEEIGRRSYSMYIIHFIFAHNFSSAINISFLKPHFAPEFSLLLCFTLTTVASYFLSGWTSKYVELFFIDKGRSLIKKISKQSDSNNNLSQ